MSWSNNIICNDYEILGERRIAFLMAWHQRLGQNSTISKYVPKDVGRLIARKYLTIDSQSVIQNHAKPIILNTRDANKFSIAYDKTKRWKNSLDLIYFKFLNNKMQILNDQVYVETPDMMLLFTNDIDQNKAQKITFECYNEYDPFITFLNKFDSKILKEMIKHNKYDVENGDKFTKSFKRRQNYVPYDEEGSSRISVKVPNVEKEIAYIKSKGKAQKPMIYKDALEQKYVGVGCKAKLLLKFAGVWKMGNYGPSQFYMSWHVVQILIKHESEKFNEGKLMILDDNSTE